MWRPRSRKQWLWTGVGCVAAIPIGLAVLLFLWVMVGLGAISLEPDDAGLRVEPARRSETEGLVFVSVGRHPSPL